MALFEIDIDTEQDNVDLVNDIIKYVFILVAFHVFMCLIYGGTPFYWGRSGGMGSNMFNDDFINVLLSLCFSILAYNIVLRKLIKFTSSS